MSYAGERIVLCVEANCATWNVVDDGEASLKGRLDAVDSPFDRPSPAFEPVRQKLACFCLLKQDFRIIVNLQGIRMNIAIWVLYLARFLPPDSGGVALLKHYQLPLSTPELCCPAGNQFGAEPPSYCEINTI